MRERFGHRVPWFDESNRLYRAFEFLETHDRRTSPFPATDPVTSIDRERLNLVDRYHGKGNLNTMYGPWPPGSGFGDRNIFRAFCAAQRLLNSDPPSANIFSDEQVDAIFQALVNSRTPVGIPGSPLDRPFRGQAVGPTPAGVQYPMGAGIADTLLRPQAVNGGPIDPRLFEVPNVPHPHMQYELLTKIYNNVTTRSNVFAVWVTVGFFEVQFNPVTQRDELGAELGRADSRNVRHRMFAVIDRSQLQRFHPSWLDYRNYDPRRAYLASGPANPTFVDTATTPTIPSGLQTVAPASMAGIQVGSLLVIDPGSAIEETVVVTAASGNDFTATFTRPHGLAGEPVVIMGYTLPQLVLHWSIIE
jgi:hypothetical protein